MALSIRMFFVYNASYGFVCKCICTVVKPHALIYLDLLLFGQDTLSNELSFEHVHRYITITERCLCFVVLFLYILYATSRKSNGLNTTIWLHSCVKEIKTDFIISVISTYLCNL